jgi:hypothetical protein
MVLSAAFVKRVAEEGLRVREYAPPLGGSIACTVTAEDDFLIGRLTANLSVAKRVDLCFCDERGSNAFRCRTSLFIPEQAALSFSSPSHHVREGRSFGDNDRASGHFR